MEPPPPPSAFGPAEVVDVDPFAGPSALDLCELVRRLIDDGAPQHEVLQVLVATYGHHDELLGRAAALADERFLREGDWGWRETSMSFQVMLGPGSF